MCSRWTLVFAQLPMASSERGREISRLHTMTIEELGKTNTRLVVEESLDASHQSFARMLADEIKANNKSGAPTVDILPVGPVQQYPIFVEMVNSEKISLSQCTFLFMSTETTSTKSFGLHRFRRARQDRAYVLAQTPRFCSGDPRKGCSRKWGQPSTREVRTPPRHSDFNGVQ